MVEGARIDHAHHDNEANRAIMETVTMDVAFEDVVKMISDQLDETLFIVTADHGHTMSFAGYQPRGNDIRGLTGSLLDDGLPYTTLSYANGKGYYYHNLVDVDAETEYINVTRRNLTELPEAEIKSFDFIQVHY
jgi:alkaline phosphatase